MHEVFGSENFVRWISFKTTSGFRTNYLTRTSDYIIWYAKDYLKLKYRQLYTDKNIASDNISVYKFLKLKNGSIRKITDEELATISLIPEGSRVFRFDNITSQGTANFDVEFEGKNYSLRQGLTWKTHEAGMKKLIKEGRVPVSGNSLAYVRFLDDFQINQLNE